jgi:hypothetical protein
VQWEHTLAKAAAIPAVSSSRWKKVANGLCISAAFALAGGCIRPPLPMTTVLMPGASMSVGSWEGTTSQGKPIAFTVSPDERVISITLGYDFADCSGTHSFDGINLPTVSDLHCIPGPCPASAASYRSFSFVDGSVPSGPYTQINGVFLPRNQAKGQVVLANYPNCGTATTQWTATRR